LVTPKWVRTTQDPPIRQISPLSSAFPSILFDSWKHQFTDLFLQNPEKIVEVTNIFEQSYEKQIISAMVL
jgi:hypothetical protein